MSEKEKPKRSTRMGFLRSCLIFSLYPLIVIKVLVSLLVFWAIGGYVKPSLDPQYIPTAEYLLDNPISEYTIQHTNENIPLSVGLTYDNSCVVVSSENDEDFEKLIWAEIYINEQLVSRFHLFYEVYTTLPGFSHLCFNGHLDTGLHIIEFRAKENIFAEPYYIQRWAIEIP